MNNNNLSSQFQQHQQVNDDDDDTMRSPCLMKRKKQKSQPPIRSPSTSSTTKLVSPSSFSASSLSSSPAPSVASTVSSTTSSSTSSTTSPSSSSPSVGGGSPTAGGWPNSNSSSSPGSSRSSIGSGAESSFTSMPPSTPATAATTAATTAAAAAAASSDDNGGDSSDDDNNNDKLASKQLLEMMVSAFDAIHDAARNNDNGDDDDNDDDDDATAAAGGDHRKNLPACTATDATASTTSSNNNILTPDMMQGMLYCYYNEHNSINNRPSYTPITDREQYWLREYFLLQADNSDDDINNIFIPTVCRAMAADLLASYWVAKTSTARRNSCPEAMPYSKMVVFICEQVATNEADYENTRRKWISDNSNVTVGEVLDGLRKKASHDIECHTDRFRACFNKMFNKGKRQKQNDESKSGDDDDNEAAKWIGQKGAIHEIMTHMIQIMFGKSETNMEFIKAPAVTTSIIQQVKALPVNPNRTCLIVLTEDTLKSSSSRKSKSKGNSNSLDGISLLHGCAYSVDMERFHAGKKKKVFLPMTKTLCNPSPKCTPKNIVATFAKASLEPFVLLPTQKQKHPSERPHKVLLQSLSQVNDKNVRTFLSMMGCDDVDVAPAELLHLLSESKEEISQESQKIIFTQEESPYMNDVARGISCDNCGKVGPELKQCPCCSSVCSPKKNNIKVVYYCSSECQKSKWDDHKADHKAAMAIMRANCTASTEEQGEE